MIDSPKFKLALQVAADAERTAPRDNCVLQVCEQLKRKGFPASRYETERKPPPKVGDEFGEANEFIVVWVGSVKNGLPAYNGFRSVVLVDRKYF